MPTITETFAYAKLTSMSAGSATVGRPTGVDGKNRIPRRSKVTPKEIDKLTTKGYMKAGGPGSGRHKVYGAITNLKTKKDVEFNGDDHKTALKKLQSLPGNVYGKHWKYAGDLDHTSPEANIYIASPKGEKSSKAFGEKDAVRKSIAYLSKLS